MLIGKNWKVESDNMNVTVFKRSYPRKKGDGTMTKGGWSPDAYFATVKGALNYLVNQEVNATELENLNIVVSRIDVIEENIDKALKEMSLC